MQIRYGDASEARPDSDRKPQRTIICLCDTGYFFERKDISRHDPVFFVGTVGACAEWLRDGTGEST